MNKIRIWQLIILITVCGVIQALSQQTNSNLNTVGGIATTQLAKTGVGDTRISSALDCEEDLRVSQQRLAKTLDNLEKAESLIKTLESEMEARKRLESVNNQIIAAKDAQIVEQKKLIEILEKQSQRKIQFFWGVVKIRF